MWIAWWRTAAPSPREDLVTELVQAGEDGDRLSGRELRAMIGGLLFAGYDTTRNQLGHALFRFALAPDQWSLLAEHPELAGQAVDEVMRLHGAVVGVPRIAAAEVEVDGWVIPPRPLVFLSLASANRDDTFFDDPLRFDITARRPQHLSFGGGPHYCLGANLARAEMEEALRILSQRLLNLRLDGEASWRAAPQSPVRRASHSRSALHRALATSSTGRRGRGGSARVHVQAVGEFEQREKPKLEERVHGGDVAIGDLDDLDREGLVAAVESASVQAECRQSVRTVRNMREPRQSEPCPRQNCAIAAAPRSQPGIGGIDKVASSRRRATSASMSKRWNAST